MSLIRSLHQHFSSAAEALRLIVMGSLQVPHLQKTNGREQKTWFTVESLVSWLGPSNQVQSWLSCPAVVNLTCFN